MWSMAENNDSIPPIPLPPAGGTIPPVEPAPAAPPAAPAAPVPPAAPGAPDPYAAPGAAPSPPTPPAYASPAPSDQPYAYAPATPGPAQGLSIAAMATGIGALFLSLMSLGFLPAVAAVILGHLGHLGQRRQPSARAFWITGLITGYVALGISLIWGAFFFGAIIIGLMASSYY